MSIVLDRQGDIFDVGYAPQSRFDGQRLRRALSHFATGVVIVTGRGSHGDPVGLTCQSFSALSLDPPLVLVCPARTSSSWPAIQESGRFAVNMLGAGHRDISGAFARSGGDKFAGVDWEWSEHGNPLLTESIATIECDVERVHDGGDHLIVIGAVRDLSTAAERPAEPEPLLYYRSGYRALSAPDLPA